MKGRTCLLGAFLVFAGCSAAPEQAIVNDAADLSTYGLDKPTATVRVGSGSSLATLLIGKNTESASVYAKDAARPAVGAQRVEKSRVDGPADRGSGHDASPGHLGTRRVT